MQTIRSIQPLRRAIRAFKSQSQTVAMVPTLGALHDGHAACIEMARKHGDILVVSIFVNPTQFGPAEDLASYPASLDLDLAMCESLGCDVVFVPGGEDMYPEGQVVWVEPGPLALPLCGAVREGHFRGVCTVVAKLFNLAEPDVAVFGQKDAQQALVIRDLVTRLSMNVDIRLCPIVREGDGLACSSRNRHLDTGERARAARIYQGLQEGREVMETGERSPAAVCRHVATCLAREGAVDVEYVELVDSETLSSIRTVRGKMLLAVAGHVGRTRLIDNLVLSVTPEGRVVEDCLF